MKMKKLVNYSLLFLLFFIVSGCGTSAPTPSASIFPDNAVSTNTAEEIPTSLNISISNFAFNPEIVRVKKGTIITWTNDDQVSHRIKSTLFSSGLISAGQTYSFTFSEAGPVDYYCPIHPSMTGRIIVE
jgi:plastocyanin